MTSQSLKIPYTIENGQFKGTKQVALIQVPGKSVEDWKIGLDWTVVGLGDLSVLAYLWYYVKLARAQGVAFDALSESLNALRLTLNAAQVDQTMAAGEVESGIAQANAFFDETGSMTELGASIEAAIAEAEAAVAGAEEAAALVPAGGWVLAAGLACGAALGATIYTILETVEASSHDTLASIVFVNGVPNSTMTFSSPKWNPAEMSLVAPDTQASMVADKARTTMVDIGAFAYTWALGGAGPYQGVLNVNVAFDQADTVVAPLSFQVSAINSVCNLTPIPAGQDIQAICADQTFTAKSGQKHHFMVYLVLPSAGAVPRISPTRSPDQPLVFNNQWALTTARQVLGRYSEGAVYGLAASFVVGGVDFLLDQISLPLRPPLRSSQAGVATVELRSDDGGAPGALVESFGTSEFNNSEDTVLVSHIGPRLAAGQRYWVCVAMNDPSTAGLWDLSATVSGLGASALNGNAYSPAAMNDNFYKFTVAATPAS